MKKSILLIIIVFSSFANAQNKFSPTDNLNIALETAYFHKDIFGAEGWSYGKDLKNTDYLDDLFIYLKIKDFNEINPIDFNYFSIVETEAKLRQRPYEIQFRTYELIKYDLDIIPSDDNFIKYSQEGITNYDHYFIKHHGFDKVVSTKQRFYKLTIPAKKNKSGEFILTFPVKKSKNSEFSLFYKNILIKKFLIKKGQRLKFKD